QDPELKEECLRILEPPVEEKDTLVRLYPVAMPVSLAVPAASSREMKLNPHTFYGGYGSTGARAVVYMPDEDELVADEILGADPDDLLADVGARSDDVVAAPLAPVMMG